MLVKVDGAVGCGGVWQQAVAHWMAQELVLLKVTNRGDIRAADGEACGSCAYRLLPRKVECSALLGVELGPQPRGQGSHGGDAALLCCWVIGQSGEIIEVGEDVMTLSASLHCPHLRIEHQVEEQTAEYAVL